MGYTLTLTLTQVLSTLFSQPHITIEEGEFKGYIPSRHHELSTCLFIYLGTDSTGHQMSNYVGYVATMYVNCGSHNGTVVLAIAIIAIIIIIT